MFVQIPEFRDYLVDENGIVVSMKKGLWRVLKQGRNPAGYRTVILSMNGIAKCKKVHSLVTLVYLGPRPNKMQVNHIDGVKENNHLSNLEYVTGKQNINHSWDIGLRENGRKRSRKWGSRLGRMFTGERHGNAKLSDEDVIRLLALRGTISLREAGKLFGVGKSHVSRIWNGTSRTGQAPMPEEV